MVIRILSSKQTQVAQSKIKAWQNSNAFNQAESITASEWSKCSRSLVNNEFGIDAKRLGIRILDNQEIEETLAENKSKREN